MWRFPITNTAISIHALREEGDRRPRPAVRATRYFYPRPPRGGRRNIETSFYQGTQISIHALREEGDRGWSAATCSQSYFYPRPPRGGRLDAGKATIMANLFLSTPSARRATRVL